MRHYVMHRTRHAKICNISLFLSDTRTVGRTSFALLKCFRAHYGRHYELLSVKKITRLQDFAYKLQSQKFSGAIPLNVRSGRGWPPTLSPNPPQNQFPRGSPSLLLFVLYETTNDVTHCNVASYIATERMSSVMSNARNLCRLSASSSSTK